MVCCPDVALRVALVALERPDGLLIERLLDARWTGEEFGSPVPPPARTRSRPPMRVTR
jgi:hypothetical protein